MKVDFQTKKTSQSRLFEKKVPISVKEGGKYFLKIKADICVPEIDLSCNELDFGDVEIGTTKTIEIRLTNNKVIPCEWKLSKIE